MSRILQFHRLLRVSSFKPSRYLSSTVPPTTTTSTTTSSEPQPQPPPPSKDKESLAPPPPSNSTKINVTSSPPSKPLDKLYKTLELEVLSYEHSVLDSYQWFVVSAATHLSIPVGKCWSPLKSDKYRFPLLKSAFVHKKHQVHYEIRTYHRFLTFHHLTESTANTFLEYIQRNLPEGCGLKVTRVESVKLPDFLQQKGEEQNN